MLAPDKMLQKKRGWEQLCKTYDVSLPAVAIAFSTFPKVVDKLVLGIATEAQLEQNLVSMEEAGRVPVEIWQEAKDRKLLEAHVPTP